MAGGHVGVARTEGGLSRGKDLSMHHGEIVEFFSFYISLSYLISIFLLVLNWNSIFFIPPISFYT
jgi:hypothetical protein